MRRSSSALATPLVLAALLAGCGSSSSTAVQPGRTSAAAVRSGGTLTGDYTAMPDSLDPALAFTQEAWTSLWPAYTSLLTYRHAEGAAGAELVPGLATAMPVVSDDGLTYSLRLRSGLTYSDGTPVEASDVEHAIARVLTLESGGAFLYENIEGAAAYERAGKPGAGISGIVTDDRTGAIRFTLVKPDGQFAFHLAMIFAAPVPAKTPFENQTSSPPPGVGPYALADVEPGQGWVLTKVASFKALPNVPAGKADRIELSVVANQRRQAQDVVANTVDFLEDPPIADQVAAVRSGAKGRYREYVTNSTYYFFLGTRTAPFDDVRVRQAVAYGVDERALARIYGGLLTPDCNYLPPNLVGYRKLDPCAYGDPLAAPDIAKAKALVQAAGAVGAPVTVWSDDGDTSSRSTAYFADLLNQLGFRAKTKVVSADTYFQTVGNATTKAQAGFANWFQDYPAAADFFQLIDGSVIQPTNNQNFGNVDDPEINRTLATANAISDPAKTAGDYAAVDRRLVDLAYVLPYGHKTQTKITSSRIAFDAAVYHPVMGLDLSTLALAAK